MIRSIKPESDIRELLLSVEKPGRYVGGEYGIRNQAEVMDESTFNTAICFPDMYEIGMSNLAIKILYESLSSAEGIRCDRVFAPAPDFGMLLKTHGIPLYGLDSGVALCDFDLVGFTLGYELSITNVLYMLELGGIPVDAADRSGNDPIIIAGGPAATNPAPFGRFFDGVFIGEADKELSDIALSLKDIKKRGGSRDDLISMLHERTSMWYPGKPTRAKREFWADFSNQSSASPLPVSSVKAVQENGIVEIMRGCPNGCRFCHAGIFYRPFRERSIGKIAREIDSLIFDCGYREITLASLSTGDYSNIHGLVKTLNNRYQGLGISFAVPSMRVNGFTLPLLEEISRVRKSGLTFAVETPVEEWQRGINKEVPLERTVSILNQAKASGWKVAKFYFMLGLPVANGEDETDYIAEFLSEVQARTKLAINVNLGTFIPKPHTPYQWSPQLSEHAARDRIFKLKDQMKGKRIQVRWNAPFASTLEGIITRGDERVGQIIKSAYEAGCKLDAWDEHLQVDTWRKVISEADWDVVSETFAAKEVDTPLPWDNVDLGISKTFLKREYALSKDASLTGACEINCGHNCGVCIHGIQPKLTEMEEELDLPDLNIPDIDAKGTPLLIQFTKLGKAAYLAHLNVMTVFERALLRSRFFVQHTQGFNPKPKIDFCHPLSLGFESTSELARLHFSHEMDANEFMNQINTSLPAGIEVVKASQEVYPSDGRKLKSMMSLYGGAKYRLKPVSSIPLSKISASILQYAGDEDIENYVSCSSDDTTIELTIRQAGKKTNCMQILKAALEIENPLTDVAVTRIEVLHKDGIPFFAQ